MYTGQNGHAYSFYSIAHDNVGNVEAPPAAPDTQVTTPALGPSLSVVSVSASLGGQVRLSIVGTPGQTLSVQTSPDLSTWLPIGTVTITNTGQGEFDDTSGGGASTRFYRLVLP